MLTTTRSARNGTSSPALDSTGLLHKLRRKSNRSCRLVSPSARNRAITAFASDGGTWALPQLACASIASTRSVVRPS
jgi:hypothetical protein